MGYVGGEQYLRVAAFAHPNEGRFAKQTMGTGDIAQSGAVVGKDPTLLHDQYGVAAKSALKLVSTSAMASSARHLRRMHTVRFRRPPHFPHRETR